MLRREFMTFVGATVAWPVTARAQQASTPIIGVLESGSANSPTSIAPAFHAGLKEFGFVEGQNVRIEIRRAEAHYDRLPALATKLIERQVAVIVATGATVSPLAAKAATKEIPIVFLMGADPIQTGLVASLNRPGTNITGITTFGSELLAKQLGMLRELVPKASRIALLLNPNNPTHTGGAARWQALAESTGVVIEPTNVSAVSDFEPAISGLSAKNIDAVNVVPDTLFGSYRESLVAVLARYAMPAMLANRESVTAGGLISYSGSYSSALRQLGSYVGRILRGERPADLPVLQPTQFDLVVNLKTAKALGLTVPYSILAQATEVVE
jgi:putative tryptophan/tyrosine transport system substrate-binding protein